MPNHTPPFRIISQREDARFTEDGKTIMHVAVRFMVGEDGPFTERFLTESFTARARDERLLERARELRREV